MTRWLWTMVLALTMVASGAALVRAQEPGPRGFSNLQVFPKDTHADVLLAAMKNFTRALGVQCVFCHAVDNSTLSGLNYPMDTNPNKAIARTMMRMTAEINGQVAKTFPGAEAKGFQTTCWTCHRGVQHPEHVPPSLKPPGR